MSKSDPGNKRPTTTGRLEWRTAAEWRREPRVAVPGLSQVSHVGDLMDVDPYEGETQNVYLARLGVPMLGKMTSVPEFQGAEQPSSTKKTGIAKDPIKQRPEPRLVAPGLSQPSESSQSARVRLAESYEGETEPQIDYLARRGLPMLGHTPRPPVVEEGDDDPFDGETYTEYLERQERENWC